MGGYGSGRRNRERKRTTAEVPALDVRALRKQGRLRVGSSASVEIGGGGVLAVQLLGRDTLSIRPANVAATRVLPQPALVGVDWVPSSLRGERPWLRCPKCRQRRAHLYLTGGLECRTCADLAYPCQHEDPLQRAKRAATKARGRVQHVFDPRVTLPAHLRQKPKGMHWTTYRRLADQAEAKETRFRAALVAEVAEVADAHAAVGRVLARMERKQPAGAKL